MRELKTSHFVLKFVGFHVNKEDLGDFATKENLIIGSGENGALTLETLSGDIQYIFTDRLFKVLLKESIISEESHQTFHKKGNGDIVVIDNRVNDDSDTLKVKTQIVNNILKALEVKL